MNETSPTKAERREESGNSHSMADREKAFLTNLIQCMRGLQRSQDRAVAKAAREWEGTIAHRIKLSMQQRKRRKERV